MNRTSTSRSHRRHSPTARMTATAVFLLAALTAACAGGGSGSPTSPGGSSGTPAPTQPGASNRLIIPGTYSMDRIRTCVNGASCGTRELPAGVFQISNEGVVLNQMRGFVRFYADGRFHFESVQRTDSPLGPGGERTEIAEGTFSVTNSNLVAFTTTTSTIDPVTMTITPEGTLLHFYDIQITAPYVPQTINVTETLEFVE